MGLYETYRSEPGQAAARSAILAEVSNRQDDGRSTPRVLHVAQSIAGGIASFFEEIAADQNEAFGKVNVHFLIPAGSEAHLPSIERAQIVTFAAITRRPGELLRFGKAALETIRRLQPDVVHLHSSFAGVVVRTFLRPATGGPRVIYCPHGWAFGMETSRAKKQAYAAIERCLARRTDLILVNSAFEHKLGLQFGLPPEKIRIVKNGIGWAPLPRRQQRSADLRLAFIGRHDRQKGLDVLLDAIERFPLSNVRFDIVGDSVLAQGAKQSITEHANVAFHGWLERSKLAKLFREVDAVVVPSRWEAFGLVAIEAMRAGVAVIGSNRGALPEVIRHGVGGYIFDLDDPDGLGRLLQRLDKEELKRLGASARTLWEEEYLADRMNRQTRETYELVLASPPSAPAISTEAASRREPAASAAVS